MFGLGRRKAYRDPTRSRGRMFIIVGLVIALMAGGLAFVALRSVISSAETPQTRSVVVAARAIAPAAVITDADVALRSVSADSTTTVALTRKEDAVGRVSAIGIVAGQVVMPGMLASAASGDKIAIIPPDLLAPGETLDPNAPAMRAISITVPDDRAVGGLIGVGQHVDIMVTIMVEAPSADPNTGTGVFVSAPATNIGFQNVVILGKTATMYILRVDAQTGIEIEHLAASGAAQFSLALRSSADSRPIDPVNYGATTNQIIKDHDIPLPRTVTPQ
jgi:Flp pilus assembly protein CpaB